MPVARAILPRWIERPRRPCRQVALEGIARNTSQWELAQPLSCGLSQPWQTQHHADVRSRLCGLDLDFGLERRSELRSVVFPHHDEAAQEVVAPIRILYFNAFHLGRVNSRPFVCHLLLADIESQSVLSLVRSTPRRPDR